MDYGSVHSDVHGHARYGREFPGVYPQLDGKHRIHIIAHSMGGQTARLFAHLLRYGDAAERNSAADVSPFFERRDQAVKSIATIATPHNGTTLVNDLDLIEGILKTGAAALAAVTETGLLARFDLDIDQWGVTRGTDESLAQYFTRVRSHPVWSGDRSDISLWDVSVQGATELNARVEADPEVYYFSWANEKTADGPFGRNKLPEISMLSFFMPGAIYMGSLLAVDYLPDTEMWLQNDGVVNCVSMKGPFLQSNDEIFDYTGIPRLGVWNFMGLLNSMDHAEVLGIPNGDGPEGFEGIEEFYLDICDMLKDLP